MIHLNCPSAQWPISYLENRRGHVKAEEEIGVVWSQAKEHGESPGDEPCKDGFPMRVCNWNMLLPAH